MATVSSSVAVGVVPVGRHSVVGFGCMATAFGASGSDVVVVE